MAQRFIFSVMSCICLIGSSFGYGNKNLIRKNIKPIDIKISTSSVQDDTCKKDSINYDVIEFFEGTNNQLYWPTGNSGPTICTGVDLGNIGDSLIDSIFSGIVSKRTLVVLHSASKIRGISAKKFVNSHRKICLTDSQVDEVNERLYLIISKFMFSKYPELINAPSSVQTVMFSLLMNRGFYNKDVISLSVKIKNHEWTRMSTSILAMRTSTNISGVKFRRQAEAFLIKHRREFTSDKFLEKIQELFQKSEKIS